MKLQCHPVSGPAHPVVCANDSTLVDFIGACYVTLGEVTRLEYSTYPNLTRRFQHHERSAVLKGGSG